MGRRDADASDAKPTHTFATPGTYQVALFVRDDNTQSGAAIHNVDGAHSSSSRSVSRASLTNEAFRVGSKAHRGQPPRRSGGTSFKFTLKAPAKVKVAISRASGRGRCGRRPAR